jgi:hypothetical protein
VGFTITHIPLVFLAGAGAKVGTMAGACRRSGSPSGCEGSQVPPGRRRVVAVWEGIRRTHGTRADQAAPLMPPELLDVLNACPVTKTLGHAEQAPRNPTWPAPGTRPPLSGPGPPVAPFRRCAPGPS